MIFKCLWSLLILLVLICPIGMICAGNDRVQRFLQPLGVVLMIVIAVLSIILLWTWL